MTDEAGPTTEEFLKMLEEAKSEWKRYNTMREAAPEMLLILKDVADLYQMTSDENPLAREIRRVIAKAEGRSK